MRRARVGAWNNLARFYDELERALVGAYMGREPRLRFFDDPFVGGVQA